MSVVYLLGRAFKKNKTKNVVSFLLMLVLLTCHSNLSPECFDLSPLPNTQNRYFFWLCAFIALLCGVVFNRLAWTNLPWRPPGEKGCGIKYLYIPMLQYCLACLFCWQNDMLNTEKSFKSVGVLDVAYMAVSAHCRLVTRSI